MVEYTPLLDVPHFDIIWDVPIEEFHLIKEGLSKLMLERMGFATINIDAPGKERRRSHAREVLEQLNHAYCNMSVFSETCRRPRPLKLGQLKGRVHVFFILETFANPFTYRKRAGSANPVLLSDAVC